MTQHPPPTRLTPAPVQRRAAIPRPATGVAAPPPTRFAPAPVQRRATIPRPATGVAAPPPTRFAPAPVQRRTARSSSAIPAAPPHTRYSLSADGAIQRACFGWCFGGKQPPVTVPVQQGQAKRPKSKLVSVGQGKVTDQAYHLTQDGPLSFDPIFITSCTFVYYRKGDYCAVAHIPGHPYNEALIKQLQKLCGTLAGDSNYEELKIYLSTYQNNDPISLRDYKTIYKGAEFYLYDSQKIGKVLLDEYGNPLYDKDEIQRLQGL
jgi:hypothetical protein